MEKKPLLLLYLQRGKFGIVLDVEKEETCFTFLMDYEHMEFPEALRTLAEKAGVQLQNQHFDSGVSSKKEKLYALNHLASEFYHYLLTKHELGKEALSYLVKDRKIKPQTINTYMLGFAPRGNALVTYLQKKNSILKKIFWRQDWGVQGEVCWLIFSREDSCFHYMIIGEI